MEMEPQDCPDSYTNGGSSCNITNYWHVGGRINIMWYHHITSGRDTHPILQWCTSKSSVSRERMSQPAAWRGTGPRWRARNSWTWRSSERKPSPLCTAPAQMEGWGGVTRGRERSHSSDTCSHFWYHRDTYDGRLMHLIALLTFSIHISGIFKYEYSMHTNFYQHGERLLDHTDRSQPI